MTTAIIQFRRGSVQSSVPASDMAGIERAVRDMKEAFQRQVGGTTTDYDGASIEIGGVKFAASLKDIDAANEKTEKAEYAKQVAETILMQIGVDQLRSMGAREKYHFSEPNPGVQFRCGPARPHCKVRIMLEPSDTYRVQMLKVKGGEVEALEDINDVYEDRLADILREWEGRHLVS